MSDIIKDDSSISLFNVQLKVMSSLYLEENGPLVERYLSIKKLHNSLGRFKRFSAELRDIAAEMVSPTFGIFSSSSSYDDVLKAVSEK